MGSHRKHILFLIKGSLHQANSLLKLAPKVAPSADYSVIPKFSFLPAYYTEWLDFLVNEDFVMNSIPWHLLFLFVSQILPIIFKFLTTSERKAVKLVSRSWFETCNLLSLSNDEVLNCFGLYQLADIYELLRKSERQCLNLKFDVVNFDDDLSFWENNGSRIRSIDFKDCQFSNGIDKIIVSCENLVHLSFIYTSSLPINAEGRKHYLRLFDNFERVLENGIVRENLNSLKIHIRVNLNVHLSDQTMRQLLTIFPKLKVLKIFYPEFCLYNFQRLDNLRTDYSDPRMVSSTDFTFAPVLNYLITSKDLIEKLKLHFPQSFPQTPPDAVRCILDTFTAMNRLTELSINLGRSLQQEDLERFLNSKPLKSFTFARWDREPVLLESLLSNCRLEHLKIWVASPVDPSIATKPLLEKLMSSGVKSCKMYIDNSILVDSPDSFHSGFLVQNRPTTSPNLSVDINRCGPWQTRIEMVQFLQYAQNILHLRLANGSYEEFQALLKYQTKLRSLITCEVDSYRINWPEDKVDVFKNTFFQLKELEHLELAYSMAYLFLSSVTPGSVLANLKYLKINRLNYEDSDEIISPSDLLKLADVAPYLKGLYISYGRAVPVDISVQLCSKLSRLQFLRWDAHRILDDDLYSDEDNRKLFAVCPSLRVVCHSILLGWPNGPKSDVFFFDCINKKVMHLSESVPYLTLTDIGYSSYTRTENRDISYTFAKPRVARHTVDWLQF